MDAMIDLETMSLRQDAAIVEIAFVPFEPVASGKVKQDDAFHIYVSLEEQRDRHIDTDTLMWWMGQESEARRMLVEGMNDKSASLHYCLNSLRSWLAMHRIEGVWGNGSSFDVAILEHAYRSNGEDPPWHYASVRDMRTILWDRNYEKRTRPEALVAHSALADAVWQAQELTRALGWR